jgi:choline-sulfatase
MIKRDHLKYQYYGPDMPEVLFDLRRNPAETHNYIDDPQYAKEVAVFRARLAELGHGPDADPDYVNAGYE